MMTNNCLITLSNPLTRSDIEEQAVIERWRYVEKNRGEELKNSKHNLSSTHQSTLTQQIQDKILTNDQEQKLSNAYARDSAKHEAIVHLLEMRQEHDRRNLARDLNEFRTVYQQSKDAREYDLNDTSMSTLAYDNESNCLAYGLGSCLFFEGEDRNKQNREKKQKEQMNRWITEQCRQKDQAIKEQQMLDQAYDYNQLMIAERIKNLQATQMMLRRQLEKDIKAFNRAFANQKRCQRIVKEAFELEDKKQEIENILVDKILTGNRNLAISQFGPQRPLLTHWKGTTNGTIQGYQIEPKIKTNAEKLDT